MIIGRRLNDRYKIIKMIGGGGMANVYLAYDIILEREVAVKVLRLDFSQNDEFINRFRREAHSVTSLSHPNIVNIYDVGEEEGIYYIVMEYIDGMTLKQYIQQKEKLSVAETLNIMEQITSAMAHAHHCEIVHRDIKPQNILVSHDGIVKVTDFGIAIVTTATTITHTNSVLGSVHYLSPEQARGAQANKKSDIYSLGIVMFELLTGRPPFSGESAVSIALKHLQSETPSPKIWNENIPQSVENIILKATSKNPLYRYDSIEMMREEIVTALDPERMMEAKFEVLSDIEATKILPVIRQGNFNGNIEHTIVHNVEKEKEEIIPKEERKAKKQSFFAKFQGVKSEKLKKKFPKIIISLFFLLIIGGILAFTVIPTFLLPKNITVIDVANLTYDKAVTKLVGEGFSVNEPKLIYDESVKEGDVVKTDPSAGSSVKEKSSITIYKSLGKKKAEMKDYVGSKYDSVNEELKSKFKDVNEKYTESNKPEGEIISQDPVAGKEIVSSDVELTVVISKGPQKVKIGNFSGWSLAAVKDFANDNKLKVTSKEDYSDTVDKGQIISQSPAANTQANPGDTINVVVSLGKKDPPPQTVVQQVEIAYEPTVPGQPQVIEIYIEDTKHKITDIVKKETINGKSTFQITLEIAFGKTGSYRVLRDGKVYLEKNIPYPS